MTSSSRMSFGTQLFGSGVSQRLVGSSVDESTNHDSGTGMLSPNLGGNVMCLNTSFSSCIRTGNEDTDFQNTNYTQGDRLNSVASDVTSVTFTLCTFNTMTIASEDYSGGAAIFDTCFFHKCTCTGNDDDGGAVHVSCAYGNSHPFSMSHSSFTECSSDDNGGSLVVYGPSPTSIDNCFFDCSTADCDGAVYIGSDVVTLSNTAFVECSSEWRGGAVSIFYPTRMSLSFLQFRSCSSAIGSNSKDIHFEESSPAISSDTVQFCDSTSGAPNVYFYWDFLPDETLVPQIDTTPTVKDLTVTFEDSEATVVVETKEAISGTMNVLLDGSNVPRLVHVVFGNERTNSSVGTVVVSSGQNGILPEAPYEHRKSTLSHFPPPTVRTVDAALKDSNTTEIVVKGVSFGEGNYWMEVEREGNEWNIALARSTTATLTGTAPLHPSTAEGRLEWETEYEVTKVMFLPKDEQTDEEVTLSDRITFTTPAEPPSPKITNLEFLFSNNLHTGCFVVLTGTNLIVGNSLNVTLNDSLSFIATVTSETEARSSELQIGWPTTLQHRKQYEITSIETMDEGDGTILFDSSITNTTVSLPADIVIFVDSGSSSESSLFCGDRVRPCSTIEDGWKIVQGVEITTFSISILHNTTQTEQVKISSQHEVVIESGPSTKPELFVFLSLSSSVLKGEGMVDVCGGRLWMHQVDIALSDSAWLIFIRMVGGDLTIELCSLVGPKGTPTSSNIESSTDLCEWETGVLTLVNSTTAITSTQLPICQEGKIEVGSLNGGDGSSETHPHLWLSHDDCLLSGDEANVNASFFIPTLSSSSTSKLNKKEKAFILTIDGTTLIPCSLLLEVFEKKKDGTVGQPKQFPLTQDSTSNFNDTTIVFSLPLSSLSSLDDSLEWRARLGFGEGEISSTSFVVQKNAVERRSFAMKEIMKWWLPLVISLCILFVIVIVVVIVCCRRRRLRKNEQKETEMTDSVPLAMEDEKVEIVTDNRIGVNSLQTFSSSESHEATKQKEEPEPSDDMIGFQNVEEVLVCSGDLKKTAIVSKDRTLYNALHSEKKWDVRVRQAQQQLVSGLKGVLKKDREAAILRALTAHNILFDSKENVCLKLNLDVTPHPPLSAFTQKQTKTEHTQQEREPAVGTNESKQAAPQFTEPVNEGVRWFAPEVIANKPHLNSVHGAVFSLGLILWEMETGCVPFAEHDAVNASRQIVTGVQPKLELVSNKEMRELISQCLCLEPVDRPDLETIESTLAFIPTDISVNPNALAQC
ncbi:hypothetical protein BLNAU_10184 [Blattamonas nauphoetae]|uniref:Protein kinase domain-containing protein n=1 Tax=Blattamonas nauphoetae TaxID=2049346 RepID=A0ABQ9XTP6_9EUKA|nr:hypothetical protein BLNAU_10184 [Blattamonas nauphoetae]